MRLGDVVSTFTVGVLVVLGGLGFLVGFLVVVVVESVAGFRVVTRGFLVVAEGGVTTAVGSIYDGLVIVGRMGPGNTLVVSNLVGWIGPSVGVCIIGPLVLIVMVGFPGSGMGSRTGGAVVSVGGAIAGEVGVGTILIGGS